MPVQAGTYDCGLFAVAFATALALGRRLEEYQFNQQEMRKHLHRCFEKQKMKMFPFARERSKKSMVKSPQKVPVLGNCRIPEIGECMIECTTCKQWFHVLTLMMLGFVTVVYRVLDCLFV